MSLIPGMGFLKLIGGFIKAWWPVILAALCIVIVVRESYSRGIAHERDKADQWEQKYKDEVKEHDLTKAEVAAKKAELVENRENYKNLKAQIDAKKAEVEAAGRAALDRQAAVHRRELDALEAEVARIRGENADMTPCEACRSAWLGVVQ